MDLATLLSTVSSTDTANMKASGEIQGAYGAAQAAQDKNASLYESIGAADAIIQGAKDQGALATQQARNLAGASFGVDLRKDSEQLTALINARNSLASQRQELSARVSAKQSVGFFDNPLQYIINQVTVDDDIAKHNALNQQTQEIDNEIQTRNALAQGTFATQTQLQESVTAASAAANAQKIQMAAQVEANNASTRGIIYGAEGMKAAIQARDDVLAHAFSADAAKRAYESQALALKHFQLSQQEFEWRKEEKKLKDQGLKDQKDMDSYFLKTIEVGRRQRMGSAYVPMDPNGADAKALLQLLKSNSPAGQLANEDYMAGQRALALDPTGNTRSLAASPADFASMVARKVPMEIPSAMDPVKGIISDSITLLQMEARSPNNTLDLKNKQVADARLNQIAQERLNEQFKLVKPGDKDNVYLVPGPRALLANPELRPVLEKLPITQKIILPALQAGVDLDNPDRVWGLALDAAKNGELSHKELLTLTDFYRRGAAVTLAARQLQSVGLVGQRGYNVALTTDPQGMFKTTEVVDITAGDDVSRATIKVLSRAAVEETANPGLQAGIRQWQRNKNIPLMPLDSAELPTPGTLPNIYNNNPEYWKALRAREGAK